MLNHWRKRSVWSPEFRRTPGIHRGETCRILSRRSEGERSYSRCNRYFAVGHAWYAATREGHDVGPCISRHQAEVELDQAHIRVRALQLFLSGMDR